MKVLTYSAILTDHLEQQGYEVLSANGAVEMWPILAENKVELVILDWDMPDVNGMDIIRQLRTKNDYKELPIIMNTEHKKRELVHVALYLSRYLALLIALNFIRA